MNANRERLTRLVRSAVRFRESLDLEATDSFRVLDGEGDGLPGVSIDAYPGRWLIQTRGFRPGRDLIEGCLEWTQSVWWKRLDQKLRVSPEFLGGNRLEPRFFGVESGVRYQCDFSSGYSQGIFLDQRINRHLVRCASAETVLNLFSYTCGFSVSAALGGAVTTSLDLSQPYLEWGRLNMKVNGLNDADHHFCRGDALSWLSRWKRSGRRFDGIIADPPTFSRSSKGGVWQVDRDYPELVERVAELVAPGGWALFCTNFRGISHESFMRIIKRQLGDSCRSIQMPPEYRGDRYLKTTWADFA